MTPSEGGEVPGQFSEDHGKPWRVVQGGRDRVKGTCSKGFSGISVESELGGDSWERGFAVSGPDTMERGKGVR